MERLQEALSRARQRREKSATAEPRAKAAPRAPVRSNDQRSVAEAWAALPPLEVNEKQLAANRVMSYFGGKDAGAFDMLRTKLVQQAKTNQWRRIAITSPTPRCGKSTMALNLAFSLSRQAELRTIVIEADLRRPSFARLLGTKQTGNFGRVLAGQDDPANNFRVFAGNVAFISNQVATSNPSELLQSATAKAALARIEEIYQPDLMLFDTAPLFATDDTFGFLENVDAAILIAAAEMSTIDEVDVAETELAEVTKVMGVVLNKARYTSSSYGYEYGYY